MFKLDTFADLEAVLKNFAERGAYNLTMVPQTPNMRIQQQPFAATMTVTGGLQSAQMINGQGATVKDAITSCLMNVELKLQEMRR